MSEPNARKFVGLPYEGEPTYTLTRTELRQMLEAVMVQPNYDRVAALLRNLESDDDE